MTLMVSVLVSLAVFWRYIDKKLTTINVGATNTVLQL